MSDTALAASVLAAVQELSLLERAGETCLPRLRQFVRHDARLQQLARLLEALQQEATASQEVSDQIRCTFCTKSAREVRVVVRAPLAAICDECVVICERVLRGRRRLWLSLRILVDSWRQVTRRARCDRVVAKLVAVADGIVGHDDDESHLGRVLAEGGLTQFEISYLAHVLSWASAPAIESSDETTLCSFCGRSDRETFISAIGAVICNVCVKSASATADRDATSNA